MPDLPITQKYSEAELRLELACALYAQGKGSAVGGSHLADVDLITFQQALSGRNIPRQYSTKDFQDDLATLDELFGR